MQINSNLGNIQVNFDGWSSKWDIVSVFFLTILSGTDLNQAKLPRLDHNTKDIQARLRPL